MNERTISQKTIATHKETFNGRLLSRTGAEKNDPAAIIAEPPLAETRQLQLHYTRRRQISLPPKFWPLMSRRVGGGGVIANVEVNRHKSDLNLGEASLSARDIHQDFAN